MVRIILISAIVALLVHVFVNDKIRNKLSQRFYKLIGKSPSKGLGGKTPENPGDNFEDKKRKERVNQKLKEIKDTDALDKQDVSVSVNENAEVIKKQSEPKSKKEGSANDVNEMIMVTFGIDKDSLDG